MHLEIRRRGIDVTDEVRDYIRERLTIALSRFGRYIAFVRMYLRDANGPRGGLDTKCRIVVALRSGDPVVVTGTDTEVFAAIARTANRARFAVRRRLKRRLARRRPSRRRLFGGPPIEVGELAFGLKGMAGHALREPPRRTR